jgi:hypothetical protein
MRLITLHRPDSLIVGTRGSRSKLATFGTFVGGTSLPFSISISSTSHAAHGFPPSFSLDGIRLPLLHHALCCPLYRRPPRVQGQQESGEEGSPEAEDVHRARWRDCSRPVEVGGGGKVMIGRLIVCLVLFLYAAWLYMLCTSCGTLASLV